MATVIPLERIERAILLIRGEKVIEAPVDRNFLVKRCTEEVIRFIERNKSRPFFAYVPHTMPHVPLGAGDRFRAIRIRRRIGTHVCGVRDLGSSICL
jgi:hypothetical protein